MQSHRFSRRSFLRGLGVTMALPWLESRNVWGDTPGRTKPSSEAPVRLAVLFSGNGFVVKVSEYSSWSTRYYGRIIEECLKAVGAPVDLVRQTKQLGRLPVVNFAAGGVATPADAALMMQMGVDGVFVGSGIFKSGDPAKRARAIVQAVTHHADPSVLAEVSQDLGEPMVGIDCRAKGFESYAGRSE